MTEDVSRIEPCLIERYDPELGDLLVALPQEARSLEERLCTPTAKSLRELVRVMNCYYSNLIEGHNTRPRDIERALSNELEASEDRRNLQLEAAAHMRVQRRIDELHDRAELPDPASVSFIRQLHREFYEEVPEPLLWLQGEGRRFRMEPGEFRSGPEHEVAVGRHRPPSSHRVEDFMSYFESRFRLDGLGASTRLIALATAHHRLNYIHPFPDGNGRVSRLMSHAMALNAGVGAHGLWSISRGLARGLEGGPAGRAEYKTKMDAADSPREGDLDGRGNLSLRRTQEFVKWFLGVCLDQVRFMSSMFALGSLGQRMRDLVQQRGLRPEAWRLLDEVLVRGELPRGEAARVTGLAERTARDLLGELVKQGLVGSATPKGPVSLRFPVSVSEILFPRLFVLA